MKHVDNSSAVYGISDEHLRQIVPETKIDQVLQKLINMIQHGWPDSITNVSLEARAYFHFREELVYADGLQLKGEKCIIPQNLQPTILHRLHNLHLGVSGTVRQA